MESRHEMLNANDAKVIRDRLVSIVSYSSCLSLMIIASAQCYMITNLRVDLRFKL